MYTLQFVILLLSSGVIAALVSAIMQKRSEKEARIFNAKLEAYKDFINHLESYYVTVMKERKKLDSFTLGEISARCLLVSGEKINEKIRDFNYLIEKAYKKSINENKKSQKQADEILKEIFPLGKEISELMREDLGFIKKKNFFKRILFSIKIKKEHTAAKKSRN